MWSSPETRERGTQMGSSSVFLPLEHKRLSYFLVMDSSQMFVPPWADSAPVV